MQTNSTDATTCGNANGLAPAGDANKPARLMQRSSGQPKPLAQPFRVLVVEDDEDLLRLYQTMLSRWPMAPVIGLARSAVNGLWMMGQSGPDLLITDLDMPGMDGFGMLRTLRQTFDLRRTTIVAVTGLDATDIAMNGGVPIGVEVLPKPIPFDRLLAIASSIFAARQNVLAQSERLPDPSA